MQYTLDQYHLTASIDFKECRVPPEERGRLQQGLDRIGEAVQDFADSQLWITIVHHPNSDVFHAQAKLKVPGQTIITGDRSQDLNAAFQRCVERVLHRVEAYREHPDEEALDEAEFRASLANDIIAPVEVDGGVLGDAIVRDDYRAFRHALLGLEENVRKRVGRWVQRYPDVQAQIGDRIAIRDIVEEVFLVAFETYPQRPSNVPFGEWLEGLIDPVVRAFQEAPLAETEASRNIQSQGDVGP